MTVRRNGLQGARVSRSWFDVFGTKPVLGRVFSAEEDSPNQNHVVVLAYATWSRLFGRDSGVVGRTITLDQRPYRVVGVMGPEFRWPAGVEVWTPLGTRGQVHSRRTTASTNR